ncbi:MAG: amino acid ABC transporter permease [Candidatus Bipolaricaulota bacterium]|nr:MAG: amino acid ABC transporter permease [Candidatus Bipolaricaulota bacterium]
MLENLIEVARHGPKLLRAGAINVSLLFALIAVGFLVGTVIAVVQVYGGRPLRAAARGFEWLFRSIPAAVLMMIFLYGPPRIGVGKIDPFLAATLALGLRSAAYQSQIFRGAIQAIPTGQMLAARSMGMGRLRAVASVILPQAFRLSVPGWSNEFSSVIKDTTLAYLVGLNEIMRQAKTVYDGVHMRLAMPTLIFVALCFLVATYAGNYLLGVVERQFRIPGLQMPGSGRTMEHSH